MNLSPHFTLEEFQHERNLVPLETVPCLTQMCRLLLEPIHAQFDRPFHVTSGYRSPSENHDAHGVVKSQHIYTAEHCAVDGYFDGMAEDMRPVFDWIRQSQLPFDQVILEHGKSGEVIHLSYTTSVPRRQALEGKTANQSAYKSWPSAAVEA